MRHHAQLTRYAQMLGALAVTALPIAILSTTASANFPTTPGGTPNSTYGTCNLQYDVTGDIIFGYTIAYACNIAVPTGHSTNVEMEPELCGTTDVSTSFTCSSTTSRRAAFDGSLITADKITGSSTCTNTSTIWFDNSNAAYYCTPYVSPWANLTTSPPSYFTGTKHLMGYSDLANKTIGTASGGFTPISVEGTYTEDVDTYTGGGIYIQPTEDALDSGGTCIGFSTTSLPSGADADSGAAIIDFSTTQDLSTQEDANVNNWTCHNGTTGYPPFPANQYGGGAPTVTDGPCTFQGLTGNASNEPAKASTDYPYRISYSGPTQLIVVDPEDASTPTQTIDGKTFSADADVGHTPPLANPATLDINITTGSSIDPHLWCYDASNWYDWGLAEDAETDTINGACNTNCSASPYQNCITGAEQGLSLYNPASWIAAGWDMGVCSLQVLTTPTICPTTVGGDCLNTAALSNAITTKIPFAYVTDGYNAIATFNTALSSATSDGACDAPNIAPWASDSTGVGGYLSTLQIQLPGPGDLGCTGTNDSTVGNIFGARPFIYDLLELTIWLATIGILWKMLPWSRQGDAVQFISQFGGLSDHFMENGVEVRQTNEGSD